MPIVPRPRWGDLSSWGLWLIVVFVMVLSPWRMSQPGTSSQPTLLLDTPVPAESLDVWQSPYAAVPWFSRTLRARWQWAWYSVQQWLQAGQAGLLLLARLSTCRTLAEVIGVLTRRCVGRYLGALPVLYALLERLQARTIINRYCRTESPVDHGAVAVVLVLNRLLAPRPLYRVMDWLAGTVLSDYVGVPVSKFNDDRLGRTLDALAEHAQAIWQDIASQALVRYHIDLSVLFYDLTALVMTGEYPDSELVDYGFAHNTPSDKQKVKLGLVVANDGGIPCLFQPWAGRTADRATVQQNLDALRTLLKGQGRDTQQVLIVGDSANLNSELALAYADHHLKYLAGVPLVEKGHRTLVLTPTERELYRQPLTDDHGSTGYWGWVCAVSFTHGGRGVIHRGLVVLSGPMRTALRRARAQQFHALFTALRAVQSKIGNKRYRTALEVQRRAETQLRRSPVGKLVRVEATSVPEDTPTLRWWIDRTALVTAMRADGRYLLATNDPNLTPAQMLARYRDKDAVEKRFRVFKQDLRVRPLFVHSDERLRAMLLINLIALLAYSLLERQAQQQGVCRTARRILEQLSSLQVIELEACDGSRTHWLSDITPDQRRLLLRLRQGLEPPAPASPASTPVALFLECYLSPADLAASGPPTATAAQ
jgi:transposase